MRRLVAVLAVLAGLVLAACSSPAPAPAPTGSSASTDAGLITPISVSRTGGIAPRLDVFAVSADGTWTYTSGGATPSRGRFTADQLSAITRAMTDPDLIEELTRAKGSTVACADEFTYTFRFGTGDSFVFAGCPTTPPAVAALLSALGAGTPF